MTKPFVSVVMTSYNRGHYIGQAIDSILSQECSFPIEIIIGDDCSTDNSREILAEYTTKYPEIIVLNLQQTNQGFGRNWASTVKLARGKYIAFLDDDDYYCDDHRLQEMSDFMEQNPEYGFVHTNYIHEDVDTGKRWVANKWYLDKEENLSLDIYYGTEIPCFGTCMIRKTLFDKYIPLDIYVEKNFPIQDWPTEILLAKYCKFKYWNKPSYCYRIYSGSMSHPKEYNAYIRRSNLEKEMTKWLCEQIGIEFDENYWNLSVHRTLLSIAYQRGDYKKAKQYARCIKDHSLRSIGTKCWLLFVLFRLLKKVKNK